jgi:GT2 family glycosyltransferase
MTKDEQRASPGVCCVIVNWNGWQDTLECLASLETQDYSNLEIIVVDNGSTNGSVERIRSAFPQVRLIETGKNLGFSKGCNVGWREGVTRNPEFLWLLNNDTVCPPDTLSKLVRRAIASPEAGMIGTVLFYAHDASKVQAWGGGKVSPLIGYSTHFYAPAKFGKNSYITFASVLARRKMLEEVGLLDEGFFMYFEDADLCIRMQRTKWKIAIAEDTAVLHKEGASSGNKETFFMAKTQTFSGLRFIRRNSRLAFLGMPVYVILRTGNRIVKREWQALRGVWQGAKEYFLEPMPRE